MGRRQRGGQRGPIRSGPIRGLFRHSLSGADTVLRWFGFRRMRIGETMLSPSIQPKPSQKIDRHGIVRPAPGFAVSG